MDLRVPMSTAAVVGDSTFQCSRVAVREALRAEGFDAVHFRQRGGRAETELPASLLKVPKVDCLLVACNGNRLETQDRWRLPKWLQGMGKDCLESPPHPGAQEALRRLRGGRHPRRPLPDLQLGCQEARCAA